MFTGIGAVAARAYTELFGGNRDVPQGGEEGTVRKEKRTRIQLKQPEMGVRKEDTVYR